MSSQNTEGTEHRSEGKGFQHLGVLKERVESRSHMGRPCVRVERYRRTRQRMQMKMQKNA